MLVPAFSWHQQGLYNTLARKHIALTKKQIEAVGLLAKALWACEEQDVYLWDNYGDICAVNGRNVSVVASDPSLDDPLEDYAI